MKKSIIFLVSIVVVTLILLLAVKGLDKTSSGEEIIKSHLEKEEFIYDEDGGYYKKNYSNNDMNEYYQDIKLDKKTIFEELYFYLGLTRYNKSSGKYVKDYVFDKVKMSYEDEIYRNYSGNYNLIDDLIKYKYEVTMYSSTIIVSGTYSVNDIESFQCSIANDRDMGYDSSELFCSRAKYETLVFLEQAKVIMKNEKFSKIIKNKNF